MNVDVIASVLWGDKAVALITEEFDSAVVDVITLLSTSIIASPTGISTSIVIQWISMLHNSPIYDSPFFRMIMIIPDRRIHGGTATINVVVLAFATPNLTGVIIERITVGVT
jgi:hypothetical protein